MGKGNFHNKISLTLHSLPLVLEAVNMDSVPLHEIQCTVLFTSRRDKGSPLTENSEQLEREEEEEEEEEEGEGESFNMCVRMTSLQ